MLQLFLIYFIVTGVIAGGYSALTQTDSDKQVYYFTVSFFVGWVTWPIKFVRGFIKTYKEIK